MTTTVCDFVNKIITADTRWSCDLTGEDKLSDGFSYFIYCDDTGFDKITVIGKAALITAGDGILIAEWKSWWSGSADTTKKPSTERDGINAVNLTIVDLEESKILFDAGAKQALFCLVSQEIKAFTSGSGGSHAASNLQIEGCAKNAISYASQHDRYTGNIVRYACYKTHTDNLDVINSDYSSITKGIAERGFMIKIESNSEENKAYRISDHALKTEVNDLFNSGKAVASAPVPGIGTFKWTEETDTEFETAMNRVRELRNK